MSNVIKHTDIAEVGVLKPLQEELIATIKILQTLEGDVKSVAISVKAMVEAANLKSSGGIDSLGKAAKLSGQAMSEADKIAKELTTTTAKLGQVTSGMTDEVVREKLELQQAIKIQKEQVKLTSEQIGAYDKAAAKLVIMQKAWKNLAIVQKENTTEGKALKAQLDQLDSAIKKVDAATGQHTRNVGNYTSGYNGLRTQINQLSRELPNFAQNATIGFMAIGNNLPMLVDEVQRLNAANKELNAQGLKGVSIWKQVGSALFNFQSLILIGITLAVSYGKEIGKGIQSLLGFKDATEDAKNMQKEFNAAMEEGINRVDSLTRAQMREIDFQTQALVIAAKKRGATQEEIDQIEDEGRKKQLKKLEDNLERQYLLLTKAQIFTSKMREFYREKESAENLKFLEDAEAAERAAWERIENARIAFENKQMEIGITYRKRELDVILKTNAEAQRLSKEATENNIIELKRRLKEIDDYAKKAIEYDALIMKAELELQKKNEEERAKIVAINQDEFEKGRKAMGKKIQDRLEKEAQDDIKRQAQTLRQATQILEKSVQDQASIKQRATDKEIEQSEKRQEQLQALAVKGVQDAQNTLAFEERRQAELEAKRIRQQKNQKRTELLFAGLKAYSANVERNPSGALATTLRDITALTTALNSLPSFFDGTEDTGNGGNLDNKRGFHAILHPNERVLTAEQNKKIGDISNDELANIAALNRINPTSFDRLIMSNAVSDERLITETREVKSTIQNLTKVIENRPVIHDRFNEVEKLVEHIAETKFKKDTTIRRVGRYGR